MAAASRRCDRSRHSKGYFKDLNELTTADLYIHKIKRRRDTVEKGRFFEVDRIITSRGEYVSMSDQSRYS